MSSDPSQPHIPNSYWHGHRSQRPTGSAPVWLPSPRVVAAIAGLLLHGLSVAPAGQARTTCSYAGPPTNLLTVTTGGFLEFADIRRKGAEMMVAGREEPTRCTGDAPTVLNTDSIRVVNRGDGLVNLELGGGPFAPGATPEAEGASEIEVEFRGFSDIGRVVGTPGADEFHWGEGGAHAGLNLNPSSAGDQDVDVTLLGRFSFLVATAGAGNDTIVPAPGAVVPRDAFSDSSEGGRGHDVLIAPKNAGAILDGGRGNDALTGGRQRDLLQGGAGVDHVAGAGGDDLLNGGPGRDLLRAEGGRDLIRARDFQRDRIHCGDGRDRVEADRRDRLRGCERIHTG